MEKETKKKTKTTTKKVETKKEEKKVEIVEEKNNKKKKPNIFKRLLNYFVGVKDEMKQVTWPSRMHMVKYTIVCICLIIVFVFYFLGIEIVFAWLKDAIVLG